MPYNNCGPQCDAKVFCELKLDLLISQDETKSYDKDTIVFVCICHTVLKKKTAILNH